MLFCLILATEIICYPEVSVNVKQLDQYQVEGMLSAKRDHLWILNRNQSYLLREDSVTVIPVDGFPICVQAFGDRVYLGTDLETLTLDHSGRILKKSLHTYQKFVIIDDRLFGLPGRFRSGYFPLILAEIDVATLETVDRTLRMPEPLLTLRDIWVVPLGPGDWLWHWSETPDRLYVSTARIREEERRSGNAVPGGSYARVFEPPRAKIEFPLIRDIQWQRVQAFLSKPRSLGFDRVGDVYLLAREVGIVAPGVLADPIFIGAELEILVFDDALTLRDRFVFQDAFGGFHDQGIYLVYDREKTISPRELYDAMTGSPLERAQALLGDGDLSDKTVAPVVEIVNLDLEPSR